jgi:excisionase family DNA binding protein
MSTNEPGRYLTPKEVAEKLGIAMSTLREWRRHGKGPKSIRFGHRTVRFDPRVVQAWIDEQNVSPSEDG